MNNHVKENVEKHRKIHIKNQFQNHVKYHVKKCKNHVKVEYWNTEI